MLRAYAPIVYVLSCLGLIAVLSPLGSTINGAHSWFVIGPFQVQPSEFAKVALVVGMAMILAEKRDNEDNPRDADVLLVLALAAVPMGLILLQPDFGTMMVFVFIILGVLAVSGAPMRWIGGLVLCGVLFGGAILHFHLLKDYQEKRLTAFANHKVDPRGIGYNVNQAVTAIGSGGVPGKGLFNGSQTNGQFVPEQQTDFVFTVAGEELGFIGAGAILLMLGVVLWRGTRIAANAGDLFGTLLAAGVVSWFAFQAFVNIGMTLGIMPVTGLPLPFVSYGGSSMFANMMAIGLLNNVHMRSREYD
jgi:rod shape determining protein RodA